MHYKKRRKILKLTTLGAYQVSSNNLHHYHTCVTIWHQHLMCTSLLQPFLSPQYITSPSNNKNKLLYHEYNYKAVCLFYHSNGKQNEIIRISYLVIRSLHEHLSFFKNYLTIKYRLINSFLPQIINICLKQIALQNNNICILSFFKRSGSIFHTIHLCSINCISSQCL